MYIGNKPRGGSLIPSWRGARVESQSRRVAGPGRGTAVGPRHARPGRGTRPGSLRLFCDTRIMEGKIQWKKGGLLKRLCFVFHGKLPGEEKCIKQSFQKVSVLLKHLWTMICVGDLSEKEIEMIVSKWNNQSHQFLTAFCSKNVVATMELNGDGLAALNRAFYVNDWVENIFERLPPNFPGINSFKESLGLIRTSDCSNFDGTKPDDIRRLRQYLLDWCSAQSSLPKPAAMLFHIPPLSPPDGYVLQKEDQILRQLRNFMSQKGFLRRRRPRSDHGPRSDHDTLAEVNYYSCFF
jgi:hypothetical protein